jgi:hypothetical protein
MLRIRAQHLELRGIVVRPSGLFFRIADRLILYTDLCEFRQDRPDPIPR